MIFSTDKTNLWDVIKTIIEDLGRGEIYHETGIDSSNNVVCNIAIVERIGTDNGVRLRLEKEYAKHINRTQRKRYDNAFMGVRK